jgi:hypothetical protein
MERERGPKPPTPEGEAVGTDAPQSEAPLESIASGPFEATAARLDAPRAPPESIASAPFEAGPGARITAPPSEAPLETSDGAPFGAEAEAETRFDGWEVTRRYLARVASLPTLLDAARGTVGDVQRQNASAITALLVEMRAPGHEEAEAREVLRALDARRFDGLLDTEGKSCRKEAVETLLAMGYPQALTVSPEDLDFARTFVAQPPPREDSAARPVDRPRWVISGVMVVLAQLVQLGLGGTSGWPPAQQFDFLLSAFAIAAGVGVAARPPGVERQAFAGTVIAMLMLAQLALAVSLGWAFAIGPGGLGFALGFLFGYQSTELHDPPGSPDWKDPDA